MEQPQPPSSVRFLCINSWVGGKPRWYTPGRRHPLLICLQDLLFIFSFVTIRGSWWQRNILLCGKSVPFASASAPTGCSYLLLVRRAQAIIEQYIFTHIISGKYCKRHADGTGGEKTPFCCFYLYSLKEEIAISFLVNTLTVHSFIHWANKCLFSVYLTLVCVGYTFILSTNIPIIHSGRFFVACFSPHSTHLASL